MRNFIFYTILLFSSMVFGQTENIKVLEFFNWKDRDYGLVYHALFIGDEFKLNKTTKGTIRIGYNLDFHDHIVEYEVDCRLFTIDNGFGVKIEGKSPVKEIDSYYSYTPDTITLYFDANNNFIRGENKKIRPSGDVSTINVYLKTYSSTEDVKNLIDDFYSVEESLYQELLEFIGY